MTREINMHRSTLQRRNTRPQIFTVIAWAALTLGACAGAPADPGLHEATAPRYLGSADGMGDEADTHCAVILRHVARIKDGPGYLTTCSESATPQSPCSLIWRGVVDVAEDAVEKNAGVHVLFSTGQNGGAWYSVGAHRQGPAHKGFVPYAFEINRYTPVEGMSTTGLVRTRIHLIPYLETPKGGRIFDHNRVADPFASYELNVGNQWSLPDDTRICASADLPPIPEPTLTPLPAPSYELTYPGFQEFLRGGPVRAGRDLEIRYDSRRLRETQSCMGSEGPASSTTIRMGWQVNDDASTGHTQDLAQIIESYVSCPKPPCIQETPKDTLLSLPPNAQSLQMWFFCVPGFSSGASYNWKYDSNLGQNYRLPVASELAPRNVDWAGAWRLHADRSGFDAPLPEPYRFKELSNMGYGIQAEVYVKGLTDQANVDTSALKAYVETDLNASCQPGGPLKMEELPVAQEHVGSYGNNTLYRWYFESMLVHCPRGDYRYRFVFSADGGKTRYILGADENLEGPQAKTFRKIVAQP
ncbi:MAG: hypothetical protein KAI47_02725 [Deltaproteobacteria bacterium]|nr:hypothetical protein [Deltaproteobacteria bacterium]